MSEQLSHQPEGESSSSSLQEELQDIIRTGRDLELYKRFLGEDFGKGEELILDVGAGDSMAADEIAALTDHHAQVIRVDAGYAETPPRGEAASIAADARALPLADNSFDKVVSIWMLPHLGPEIGEGVMSELMRVVKPEGQILLSPARPFKQVEPDYAEKRRVSIRPTALPMLAITKPADFDEWSADKKAGAYQNLASYVTYGGARFKLMKWGYAKVIERAGTNRSIEQGRENSLSPFKRKKADLE